MQEKNEWSEIGDDIKNIVSDAIDSMDFSRLNRELNGTVNRVINEVKRSTAGSMPGHDMNGTPNYRPGGNYPKPYTSSNRDVVRNMSQSANQGSNRTGSQQVRNYNYNQHNVDVYKGYKSVKIDARSNSRKNAKILNKFIVARRRSNPVRSFVTVIGTILTVSFAFSTFGSILDYSMFEALNSAIMCGISSFLLIPSFVNKKRMQRFTRYCQMIGDKEYCELDILCDAVGKDKRYVIKDLRKLIELGYFPEGHIDREKQNFILSNDLYKQYLQLGGGRRPLINEEPIEEQIRKETEAVNKEMQEVKDEQAKQLEEAVESGRKYIAQIKAANDAIPDEVISMKLSRLELLVEKIFLQVSRHPEQLSEIRKLMEYYLPTTLKLVNTYADFEHQQIEGDNINKVKSEIAGTLDTINMAFEKLFDGLFEDTAIDVSTDISVLQTMFAQEGLTGEMK